MIKDKFTSILPWRLLLLTASFGSLFITGACNKTKAKQDQVVNVSQATVVSGKSITRTMTVANVSASADGTSGQVMFLENQQVLNVYDATVIATLKNALKDNTAVTVTYDPWQAIAQQAIKINASRKKNVNTAAGSARNIDVANVAPEIIDNPANLSGLGIINSSSSALTSVIPDMATAQLMFDYITHQCCATAGPHAVDYCISFQYCEDGCYARAHKMCYILNNRYRYATQKVFSFANAPHDVLSVKAEKWGGCCINWWYHVAPLVTIQTPKGPKAYVFDPAMFDQPVLLSQWLHAQQNPACVSGMSAPHVTMINVQPTSSYSPATYAGTTFDTDDMYADTDTTLVNYGPLVSCP